MPKQGPMTDFIKEATRIVEVAKKRRIAIRVIGACAIKMHCPRFQYLYDAMKRELSDLDFMAYDKDRKQIKSLFIEHGYVPDKRFVAYFGMMRHVYYDEANERTADVFFNTLEMCHSIDLISRLELDFPTIALADLLLEKMQIVQISEKDIKDAIILLREHDIGPTEKETINVKYISELLAKDWGFYHTVTTNLGKVKKSLTEYQAVTEEDRKDIIEKVNKILEYIEKEPKSMRWRMRAKIGQKKKWYRDVETVVR